MGHGLDDARCKNLKDLSGTLAFHGRERYGCLDIFRNYVTFCIFLIARPRRPRRKSKAGCSIEWPQKWDTLVTHGLDSGR